MNRPTPPVCNPDALDWHKSTYSSENGACVETAHAPGGWVAVRDSKDPSRGVTFASIDMWASFVTGVRAGTV
ncbi:DUF397 domain-containing protein [Streptomyces sp. NPDC056656]|uniref:DUF397 domain-containing protein n=1 Tax=Streptomyces sp. NPDC056656 TaxID=3345895 RepID=UPI0036AB7092